MILKMSFGEQNHDVHVIKLSNIYVFSLTLPKSKKGQSSVRKRFTCNGTKEERLKSFKECKRSLESNLYKIAIWHRP